MTSLTVFFVRCIKQDMSRSNDCGSIHRWSALSYTTSTCSTIMCLLTIPLNTAVIVAIIKSGNYTSQFYIIMLNIAVSDLLLGVLTEPLGAALLIEEGLGTGPKKAELSTFLASLFVLGTSSVLSMALLNIDRYLFIQFPAFYETLKEWHLLVSLSAIWLVSAFSGYLSLNIGFTRYLLIFSLCTVLFTVGVMFLTMRTFWKKLVSVTAPNDNRLSIDPDNQNSRVATTKVFSIGRFRATSNQRRIIRTLFFMLAIFITSYFPVFLACIYLNMCHECDCLAVHILRDVVILAILVSSVARPINFLHRLSNLRNELRCLRR